MNLFLVTKKVELCIVCGQHDQVIWVALCKALLGYSTFFRTRLGCMLVQEIAGCQNGKV